MRWILILLITAFCSAQVTLTEEELKGIDVVIPIPDTSKTSALPLSIELDKKHITYL